jgi:hypothetical protein
MIKNKKDLIMYRVLILIISFLYSCHGLAKSDYQIDLIIFAQPLSTIQNNQFLIDSPLIPMNAHERFLKPGSGKISRFYSLLPASYSSLQDQYYQLSRKSSYPVLGHYTWRQSEQYQNTVALPLTQRNGWQIQGTFHIRKSNYYHFDAKLQIAPPHRPNASFTVSQKHRLKENVVYYLDNDNMGMIVKIHKIG